LWWTPPSTPWTSYGMARRIVRVFRELCFYSWGDRSNLRTREKRGKGVHVVTTQNSTIMSSPLLIQPWVLYFGCRHTNFKVRCPSTVHEGTEREWKNIPTQS
jgi:hypothetical protein